MNKKGFTLVELLAVMVVLIIVILIAITRVRKTVDKSADEAIKANAGVVIKAVNAAASNVNIMQHSDLKDGVIGANNLSNYDISISGTKPDDGYFVMEEYEVKLACLIYDGYKIEYNNGNFTKPEKGDCTVNSESVLFAYTGNYDTFTAEHDGIYKVELWGASGSNNTIGGMGAYTSGNIRLKKGDILYVYVGQNPGLSASATFNGGGGCSSRCTAGGGATDVRLKSGDWNDSVSLASRIMVAAGGAGYDDWSAGYKGGYGGALTGVTGEGDSPSTGGSQTAGGISNGNITSRNGMFGIAGFGDSYGGGGSGGYWGGAGGKNSSTGNGGSSGSSYISGYTGCVAIKSETEIVPKDGCDNGTTDKACSIHYSGKVFTDGVMKAGNETVPSTDDTMPSVGHSGNGYAKITLIAY